jgi:hypothetical protein
LVGDTEGSTDALALTDDDGDTVGATEAEPLRETLCDSEALPLTLAVALALPLSDAEAVPEGVTDGVGSLLPLWDVVIDAVGETVSELVAEALPLTLDEPDALLDTLALALWVALGDSEALADTDGAADWVDVKLDVAVADGDTLALAHRLSEAVSDAIAYRPGATHAHTTAAEALARGEGVCQDHAHALVAVAQAVDFPARYVSGYLLTLSDGDAEEAEGELLQSLGDAEPAEVAALAWGEGGEDGVEKDGDLGAAGGDDGGPHEVEDIADALVFPFEVETLNVSKRVFMTLHFSKC